jgi:hypothetical protein
MPFGSRRVKGVKGKRVGYVEAGNFRFLNMTHKCYMSVWIENKNAKYVISSSFRDMVLFMILLY